jgi:hypothetical protein
MRYLIARTITATAIALTLLVGVSAATVPTVRHIASGLFHTPDRLAASPEFPCRSASRNCPAFRSDGAAVAIVAS